MTSKGSSFNLMTLIYHKVENETQAIILLNTLLDKFKDVNSSIIYGRDKLTTNLVVSNLMLNDFRLKDKSNVSDKLYVGSESKKRENYSSKGKNKSRSK